MTAMGAKQLLEWIHKHVCWKTDGSLVGALVLSCLLTLKRPKTTSIAEGVVPNSSARKPTMWSVARPKRGATA